MIYLDNNATTRPFDCVIEAMTQCHRNEYANASSIGGQFLKVHDVRRRAAEAMRDLLSAEESDCFVFTSGATESNNWVMGPIARSCDGRTVIISEVEHPSVSEPARALAKVGFRILTAKVDRDGLVDLDHFRSLLDMDVALVSVQAANNETGAVQPLREISLLIRRGAPCAVIHTDATQAVGKMLCDLQGNLEEIDLLSFSAHKFHGPKGIGGLYIRPGTTVEPMLLGGGQEMGLRSGTSNAPSLAGLAEAAVTFGASGWPEGVNALRNQFEDSLLRNVPEAVIHSRNATRLPNTSYFSIPGIVAEGVAHVLASMGVLVGTGSACSSGALHPSDTLLAMGIDYDLATAALRVSLSPNTTEGEITETLRTLCDVSASRRARREGESPESVASEVMRRWMG